MRFLYKQFPAKKKEIIEVDIDVSTKVKFMTAREMAQYKKGRTHSYYGGTYEPGRVRFVIPFDSIWNVVVEKGTYHRPIEVRSSVHVLPPDREVLSTVALDAPPDPKRIAAQAQNNPDEVGVE